jgi:NADPH-dependent 7-cyano-7-deazaguanine reductase QueF
VEVAKTVPCDATVTVSTAALMRHRCPFVDELDRGTVHITWTTAGRTFELHALADWLAGFADQAVSHEELTERIRAELAAADGVTAVAVRSEWTTAGTQVEVTAGVVPREPHRPGRG